MPLTFAACAATNTCFTSIRKELHLKHQAFWPRRRLHSGFEQERMINALLPYINKGAVNSEYVTSVKMCRFTRMFP